MSTFNVSFTVSHNMKLISQSTWLVKCCEIINTIDTVIYSDNVKLVYPLLIGKQLDIIFVIVCSCIHTM